jgi:hypothetical protein
MADTHKWPDSVASQWFVDVYRHSPSLTQVGQFLNV